MAAPNKPVGLSIEAIEPGIRLSWIPNVEPDMDKYRVFRQSMVSLEIELKAEVDHPTVTWDDSTGSDLHRYYLTAVNTAGEESQVAGPVFLTKAHPEELCRVVGKFVNQDGSAAGNNEVKVKIVGLPYGYKGKLWKGQDFKAWTDMNGIVEFMLPRLAKVMFFSMPFGINKTVMIPNRAYADLMELIR